MRLKKPEQTIQYTVKLLKRVTPSIKFSFLIPTAFILCLSTSIPALADKNVQGDATVLFKMKKGVKQLYKKKIVASKQNFMRVVAEIGAIWADNEEAAKARSLWYAEAVKPFKGEPYERMMAYYYMGLIFMMEKDYGNAQASFKNSLMQDAFAEEENNRADVILPVFLRGWALQRQRSFKSAEKQFEAVKHFRPDIETPEGSKLYNTLLIVETGRAPRKKDIGYNDYHIKYVRGKRFKDNSAVFSIDGAPHKKLKLLEDIYYQASTRGGREIDSIIAGKVKFKKTSKKVARTLKKVGDDFVNLDRGKKDSGGALIGLLFLAAGGISNIVSENVNVAPDFRYWNNLPDKVHIAFFDLSIGKHEIVVKFLDKNSKEIKKRPSKKTVKLEVKDVNEQRILWVSAWKR